jgi:hypothetical protein
VKKNVLSLSLALSLTVTVTGIFARPAGEFLTEEEIELIQINQKVDSRIKLYLKAAALRLKSTEARLRGKETEPGDPLEYFTPEDMLDGYYRILNSVMFNLDDAYQNVNRENNRLKKALKALQKSTKESLSELEFLEKLAKEQNKSELLRLIRRAIEITNGAHEGAADALSEKPPASEKNEYR